MSKAGKRLIGAAKEAVAIARGQKKPAGLHVAPEIDVKGIRAKTGLSQDDFAAAYGFTIDQIKAWEQNRSRPQGGVRTYLLMIRSDPKAVMALVKEVRRKAA